MATAEQNEQLNAILDAHPLSEVTWPGYGDEALVTSDYGSMDRWHH